MRIIFCVALLAIASSTHAQSAANSDKVLTLSYGQEVVRYEDSYFAIGADYLTSAAGLPVEIGASFIRMQGGRDWQYSDAYGVHTMTGFVSAHSRTMFHALAGVGIVEFGDLYRGGGVGAQFSGYGDTGSSWVTSLSLPFDVGFLFQPNLIGVGLKVSGYLTTHQVRVTPSVSVGVSW